MAEQRAPTTGIVRFQRPALIVGIIGLAASAIGWFINPEEFFRGYLPSFIFWFSIVAGCLAVLMLQYTTGGEWGLMIRRPLAAAARTMMWMVLFAIPVAMGMKYLYPWMNLDWARHDEVVSQKLGYLNWRRFGIFAVAYFGAWILWAWRIRALSLQFYKDRSPYTDLARRRWAAAGLPMIVLTLTFASIDWMMSLEPKWSSTMYGITFTVGCGLSAFAFVTFFLARLATTDAMRGILKPTHLRDLGNLMLAFVMFYAYVAFSEFLLIWYANLHEEIGHYIVRIKGSWGAIAAVIIIFHFFLPFFMLLMRSIKDRAETISVVTVVILIMRYVAIYWLIAPSWYDHFHYSIWSLTSLVGIGGVWIWTFIEQLKGQTIIPIHETWVEEAIREGAIRVNA
ncbi:MAG TPA: hypothetical protein VER58_07385 [Thermoanaerobaculia bacterium]|nr:hypothetical protein [Thermoanaerobaculia bacterium]